MMNKSITPTHLLSPPFFARDTLTVARDLLGCQLWRYWHSPALWVPFTIVETEAYTEHDPACHAYSRKTGRAATLYREPGTAYVYFIYGMYDCLNVVTEPEGKAGAVLFRALQPPDWEPVNSMKLNPSGPGRLTRDLSISRHEFNGVSLTRPESGLCLTAGATISDEYVITGPRVGIRQAADWPWRFYVRDNAWVSKGPSQSSSKSGKKGAG